jgi:hypothetical protein
MQLMKSTNNNNTPFSIEDFEKGLMLAGLISPSDIRELNERQALETHEKSLKQESKTTYFKRVVLAAEIANQLHAERTFGRVKFQKIMYLCEHAAEMNLQSRYSKQAAGPFDNKFMHTIELEFKKNKWFSVDKISDGGFTRTIYRTLENVENYKGYFTSYFKGEVESISKIINLFRTAKTDTAEIAATLYACRIELCNSGKTVFFRDILQLFYDWSEKKQRFDNTNVRAVWNWMVDVGLVDDVSKDEV